MLPSRPDKGQLMRRVSPRSLLPQANRKRRLIFFFVFEVARSRSSKIWTEPEWVVERRGLGPE